MVHVLIALWWGGTSDKMPPRSDRRLINVCRSLGMPSPEDTSLSHQRLLLWLPSASAACAVCVWCLLFVFIIFEGSSAAKSSKNALLKQSPQVFTHKGPLAPKQDNHHVILFIFSCAHACMDLPSQ